MSIKAKHQYLLQWLQQWVDLPKQGSDAWLTSRMDGCGGSELKRLLSSEKEFVAQKCDITKIPDLIQMTWGSVFEVVSRSVSEILFSTKIYEASSIPSIEHPRKTYSLDGIGLVKIRGTFANRPSRLWLYVLFEYKNLWSRTPIHGSVYPEYIPQVKSGMADLGIPELAIYMEQVVRVCSIKQLRADDESYNTATHTGPKIGSLPIGCGIMIIHTAVPRSEFKDDALSRWINCPGQDMGDIVDVRSLHPILRAIKSGSLLVTLSPIHINMDRLREKSGFITAQGMNPITPSREELIAATRVLAAPIKKNNTMLGYLPFKIMDINIVPVEKEVGYTAKHGGAIDAAISKVLYLRSIDDIDKRSRKYYEMYSDFISASKMDLSDMLLLA